MMMTKQCNNCGVEGSLPFHLDWEYESRLCKDCGHVSSSRKDYYFCSDKCLKSWVVKFVGHHHRWASSDYMFEDMPQLKDKTVWVNESCKVCGIIRLVRKEPIT